MAVRFSSVGRVCHAVLVPIFILSACVGAKRGCRFQNFTPCSRCRVTLHPKHAALNPPNPTLIPDYPEFLIYELTYT
ncbi:hypothetical protein PR002_g29592 [Phytophthora rubi]|uniref:Secreted protein n=1 Tax=Phytophthora rubi TaxID=129364 RepID=A0A6A3H016_9STRA|nr:hypothetical protein PR002_g29592 [Phytophthora rubi]